MYNFILQFLIMASLAALIYLIARTVPRINDSVFSDPLKKSFFDDIICKLPLEEIDLMVENLFEKSLRKFKIIIMKLDNVLTKKLSGFKASVSNEKDSRPNIFGSAEKKTEE